MVVEILNGKDAKNLVMQCCPICHQPQFAVRFEFIIPGGVGLFVPFQWNVISAGDPQTLFMAGTRDPSRRVSASRERIPPLRH